MGRGEHLTGGAYRGSVFGIREAGDWSSYVPLQKMKLLPGPEIIRQKSHGCSEQKRRAMMGRFLA